MYFSGLMPGVSGIVALPKLPILLGNTYQDRTLTV